ncbi:MAG TPA: M3 family metallopeptidase [Terriglobales bacterium]|nr:M3 family metallopeptidase [Terriglobales bacterium]
MRLRLFGVFLLVLPLLAQIPPAATSVDLARYYFASPEVEVNARADFRQALTRLQTYKGRINSAPSLLAALHSYESTLQLYSKHDAYLHFRCAQDRKGPFCSEQNKLESELDAASAFLRPEILSIPEPRLKQFIARESKLRPYAFAIADIRRDAPYVLPASEERLLGSLRPEIADWQYELYDRVIGAIPFGTVQTSTGLLNVIRQRNLLVTNPDPRVREEAFKRRFNGLSSQRDLLAFALVHTVNAQDALAKAHHYADAPARKYTSLYLAPDQTRKLLDAMAEHGDIPKRFEEIRAADFERSYHSPAHAWDLAAPEPDFMPPNTPLAAMPAVFHEVFAALGPEYQAAFDALLNPANRRTDIVAGGAPNRYTGGFSVGSSGVTSLLFYGQYDGTFKDLSVIAHEGGHATHRTLMTMNGVRPIYATGPNFLFESFAEFNELLLADYLAEHASDPVLKRFYRKQWMGIKGLDAFYGAQDALLEQAIYDGVAAGKLRTADDLDKITVAVDSKFSIFPPTTPELRNRWAAVSLIYEDPLYDVNYVYGGLLALKYYQLYQTDREHFVPRYVAFLKNGFDAPPAVLLKKFLGIDLFSPQLLTDDINLLNSRLKQLDRGDTGDISSHTRQ